ncbi:MAG: CRISPR-associated endonuclease Cas2 [Thiotrichales bacterium]
MIAYDVRHPKRLRKLHYYLSKKTFAVQKSVYLLRAEKNDLDEINKRIKEIVHAHQDDVRLFPVLPPQAMWVAGQQGGSLEGLFSGETVMTPKPAKRWRFPGFGRAT